MGVKSAERVLEIFELLKDYPSGLTAKEIGNCLDYAGSSTFGLVKTLLDKGYLLEDSNKRYTLGAKLIQLGEYASAYLDINKVAEPILNRLMQSVSETVFMAVLSDQEIIYTEIIDCFRSISTNARLGGKKPLYCTGLGKAFLSFLPEQESEALIEGMEFVAYTPNTISNPGELKAKISEFRKQGYAIDNEEIEVGLYCFAAPVYGPQGRMEAAISVSGPTARMKMNQENIIRELLETSKEISEKMGYDGK
ncbi:MAG: IclR family transcriptional regulator [Lachnospiraceae bacterium]|nr:IclR family transcriptional regulator [Lachnospiraceae bacterium]